MAEKCLGEEAGFGIIVEWAQAGSEWAAGLEGNSVESGARAEGKKPQRSRAGTVCRACVHAQSLVLSDSFVTPRL